MTWGDKGYAFISYDYHELFANEVLALHSIKAMPAFKDKAPAQSDLRLKVMPRYNKQSPYLEFSLCNYTDGPLPEIESMSYKLYSVDKSGNKQFIEDHGVILGVYSIDWGFRTNALNGHSFTMDDLTGKTITAELTYRVKGSLATYTNTYTGIKFKVGEYRAT